jgi:hypothetical protein
MTGTHYDVPDGHQYYSPVDEPEHLDAGDVDDFGRCCHQNDASTCRTSAANRERSEKMGSVCTEHPGCAIVTCAAFSCNRSVHLLPKRGRPRRYCSGACRKAEYKRLGR